MENNNKEVEQFNITSLWHKSIYEALIRTEEYEKICRIGGVEVAEALQQDPAQLPYIKFQYLNIFIVELKIILDNTRAKVDKLFYLKSSIQLLKIQEDIDYHPKNFMKEERDEVTKEEWQILTSKYYDCLKSLSKIRAEVVWRLKDTLFGEIREKAIGMDKNRIGEGLTR